MHVCGTPGTSFRILSPLLKFVIAAVFLLGLSTPLAHANPDDNSLEYFLTHARALVHDVRENLLKETDPSATYLIVYEQELGMKLNMLRGLKYNATQELPKDSELSGWTNASPKDMWIAPVLTKEGKIWGIKADGALLAKVFPFKDPVPCPFEEGDPRRKFFLENVVRSHSYGLNERAVKGYLPEGTPFDPEISQSISQFLLQVRELEPFWKKAPAGYHPYVQFCSMMFPYLILNFSHSFDDASRHVRTLIFANQEADDPSSPLSYEEIRSVWNDFFQWTEMRLNRIRNQNDDDDEGAKPSLQAQYGKRLKRLLQIHPFKDNFKFCSPPKSDSSSKSEE